MLTIYIKGVGQSNADVVPAEKEVITDVEAAFISVNFSASESNCRLVKEIDQGTLLDRRHFTDRFGVRLYTDMLSTGGKTALLVNNTNKVVDIKECGWNARDAIITYCRDGAIVMEDPSVTICTVGKGPVEVSVDGKLFHDLDALNDYIFNRRIEEMINSHD